MGFVWRGVRASGKGKNGFVSEVESSGQRPGVSERNFFSRLLPMSPRQEEGLMGLWRGLQVVQEDFDGRGRQRARRYWGRWLGWEAESSGSVGWWQPGTQTGVSSVGRGAPVRGAQGIFWYLYGARGDPVTCKNAQEKPPVPAPLSLGSSLVFCFNFLCLSGSQGPLWLNLLHAGSRVPSCRLVRRGRPSRPACIPALILTSHTDRYRPGRIARVTQISECVVMGRSMHLARGMGRPAPP